MVTFTDSVEHDRTSHRRIASQFSVRNFSFSHSFDGWIEFAQFRKSSWPLHTRLTIFTNRYTRFCEHLWLPEALHPFTCRSIDQHEQLLERKRERAAKKQQNILSFPIIYINILLRIPTRTYSSFLFALLSECVSQKRERERERNTKAREEKISLLTVQKRRIKENENKRRSENEWRERSNYCTTLNLYY